MTHDFTVPIRCTEKKCGSLRESAGTKWVYIQPLVQNFLLELNPCQFGVPDHNSDTLGSQIGLAREKNPQIPESGVIHCSENQILIFNICPVDSFHLSSDKIFKNRGTRSQKDLVGVSLFLSQSLKVIPNRGTKSKEVVIHINYIYIPNITSRELIVGLLT